VRRSALLVAGGALVLALGFAGLLTRADFTRWLYRGRRPHRIARILMKPWEAIASSGIAPGYLVTLEVTGRTSRRTLSLPLVVAAVDGQRYVVSMLGDDVQWVRNVRAAGGRAVLRSGVRRDVVLEEVPSGSRAAVLQAYLRRTPGARPHIPVDKDAPIEAFEKIAAAYPVFRVTPPPGTG
jgi:deazaflavin-dependent oxidoreductase (nitroreductase family)